VELDDGGVAGEVLYRSLHRERSNRVIRVEEHDYITGHQPDGRV
jgi:hypothetical protein